MHQNEYFIFDTYWLEQVDTANGDKIYDYHFY